MAQAKLQSHVSMPTFRGQDVQMYCKLSVQHLLETRTEDACCVAAGRHLCGPGQKFAGEERTDLFGAVDISSHMGNSVTGLCGAAGPKLNSLPPHGVLLRAALLQGNNPAEHDVHTSQNLKSACSMILVRQKERKQLTPRHSHPVSIA